MSVFGTPELPLDCVKEPCNECPWRRKAAPGWLGPYDANDWIKTAQSDTAIACHKTIKQSGAWEGTKQCRGASIFRSNIGKMSRDPRVVVSESDFDSVFGSPEEFILHHEGEEGMEQFYEEHPWLRPQGESDGGTERQERRAEDAA